MARRSAAFLALVALAGCVALPDASVPRSTPAVAAPTPRETLDDPRLTQARIDAADRAAWQILLARPLRLPTVARDEACPLSPRKGISDGLAPALGDGPIYAVTVASWSLAASDTPRQPSGFYELKMLWVATDAYREPAVIRGDRIDGSGPLLFNGGDPEIRLSSRSFVFSSGVPRTWRQFPSTTDVRGPGCYALQVDGTTFTDTVVFEVVP